MTRAQDYRRFLRWLKPYWKMLSLAVLGMVIMALTVSALPIMIKQILDGTITSKYQETIQLILLAIIALFIVRGIASYISTYAINIVGSRLERDLRITMFDKLLALPARCYSDLTNNYLSAIFVSNIKQIIDTTANIATILVKDLLTIIGLVAYMFYLNWELSVLILLIAPMIILILELMQGYLKKTSQQIVQASEAFNQGLLNAIKHYRVIKLYGGHLHKNQHLRNKAVQIHHTEMQQATIRALIIPLGQVVIVIILTAFIHLIVQQVYSNEIAWEEACSLIIAAILLILPIQHILKINNHLRHGGKLAGNLFLLLDQETELDTGTKSISHARGELVFEKISFYHDTQKQYILDNISLIIKPGETIALVGTTDSENTALIDLLLRFHPPTTGKILLDGQDLANLKLNDLRANIAMISADEILLDENVATNIAYGNMRCTHEAEITAASQASHAMKFIREMPEGLQTQVGEDGIELSQKQCQLIAIARAFLRDPSILILNGIPTATTSESDPLHNALETLMQGRTTLIFTQHLPTLKNADHIIVLRNGCISETGKHQELLNKQGFYSKLIQSYSGTKNPAG